MVKAMASEDIQKIIEDAQSLKQSVADSQERQRRFEERMDKILGRLQELNRSPHDPASPPQHG
jgi:seryl-tRNA synthetase